MVTTGNDTAELYMRMRSRIHTVIANATANANESDLYANPRRSQIVPVAPPVESLVTDASVT